jgi:uncharacterized phage protein gp47/JayE
MTSILDFPVVFSETLARVRARMDQDVNAGADPSDPAYVDTREGSFYWDLTQVAALEIARLWDAFTEAVAAAFPSTAWGSYLDEHGQTFALNRNPAIAATGTILFTTSPGAVLIPSNTQVSAEPTDPTGDEITFQTTASGTTVTQLAPPGGVTVTPSGTGGTLTTATYIYHVTAYNSFGETTGSADQAGVIATSTGENAISWSAVSGATGYRVYRTLTPNTLGGLIVDTTSTSYTDTGAVTPGLVEPSQNTTAGVRLPATCITTGTSGNLAAGALNQLDTPIPQVTAVINEAATVGGADQESDDDFRARLLAQFQGQGSGCIADYVRWSLAFGIERVTVVPLWNGPGTVLVVAMLSDGSPVSSTEVDGLQGYLDPIPGQGHGQAPIGAQVTVKTSTVVSVTVSASVNHETGYSLDGTNGTTPTRAAIEAALGNYINSLQPGDTIVYQHVQAAFFVPGVHSISGLLLNGATADVPLAAFPTPQVASLATPTLS